MYVDAVELQQAVRDSQLQCRMSDRLVSMVQLIAERVMRRYRVRNEDEDCIQDTCVVILQHLYKINTESPSALFNFVSTVAINVARNRKRQQDRWEQYNQALSLLGM